MPAAATAWSCRRCAEDNGRAKLSVVPAKAKPVTTARRDDRERLLQPSLSWPDLFRASRLVNRCAPLIGMAGINPAMTILTCLPDTLEHLP